MPDPQLREEKSMRVPHFSRTLREVGPVQLIESLVHLGHPNRGLSFVVHAFDPFSIPLPVR